LSVSDCPSAEELAGLVEGRLSGDALERVAAHVDACPSCLAAAEELRPTDVVVTTLRRGSAPAAPPPGDRQGRYAPLWLHAAGGLGEVHVAEDTELRRKVALKRIRPARADDPDSRRRFLREAEITARLEHPGIVPVHGLVWDAQGGPRYAMRFVEGESLHHAIREFHAADGADRDPGERRLALRGLLGRFVAVCQTVAYAHSKGVVHRDLKPANVMLGRYGETLVVDWGLAREMRGADRETGNADTETADDASSPPHSDDETGPGQVVGTPAFMSPEQAAGRHAEVGPASDVYLLGGTLYTILTGRPPREGGAAVGARTGQDKVAAPRQVNRSVPAALEAVCLKAMAEQPHNRYASASELGAEVERWLAGEPVRAYPERWPTRAARWARRHRVAVGGLAAGLLVAAVLGGGGAVWLAREAADRRAERTRLEAKDHEAVARAMAELPELVRAWRFREAEGLLNQTAIGLSEFAPAEERARLADALTDARLARQLDAIRLSRGVVVASLILTIPAGLPRQDTIRLGGEVHVEGKINAAVVPEYRAAFEQHGLDTDEVDAVGRRVAASPIREVLVAALDDWAASESDAGRRDRLTRIAKAADPDPWRDQFRDALARRDRDALRQLAAQADAARLSPTALVALGLSLGPKTPEAADVFSRAQARYPADYWLNFWLVPARQQNGGLSPAEALRYYQACLVARPDAAPAHNNLGVALYQAKYHAQAEAAYRRAIELDPTLADPHINLGNALRVQNKVVEAEAEYLRASALDSKFALPHFNLGNSLIARADLAGAATAFRRAIELDPNFAGAYSNLGTALGLQGDLDGAIAAFRRAIELDPNFADTHFNLGTTLLHRGDWAGAEAKFRDVIEIDPKHVSAHTNLGFALFRQGNRAGAEKASRRAIELDPKETTAHVNLGNLLDERRDHAGAEASYRRALEVDPAVPNAHFGLGNALREQGDHAGAAAAYRRAIELNPKYMEAHANLAILLFSRGDNAGAAAAFRRVVELEPGIVLAHDYLGVALLRLGRFDEVRTAAKRALELFPPGQPGHAAAAGRLREAEQMLKLDQRLPAVLRGEDQPADLTEYAAFAGLAGVRRRYAGSARLYDELFRKDPAAAEVGTRRYSAICAAAQAGCGQGEDDPTPDAAERARLRQQALDWLRASLKVHVAGLAAADPKVKDAARRTLRYWQETPDLAGVRDAAGLAALPADEQDAWRKFWADVAAALAPERK
jgi:tetratricopeptide (TPR) repeat protein/tRNA A-37 threonylcarbamoyl transferase component Bud32